MARQSRLTKVSLIVGIVAGTVAIGATMWGLVSGSPVASIPVAAESKTGVRVPGVIFELNDGSHTKPTDGKGLTWIDPRFVGTGGTALRAVDFSTIEPVVFHPVKGGTFVKVVLVEVLAETR